MKKFLPYLICGIGSLVLVGIAGSFGAPTSSQFVLAYLLGAANQYTVPALGKRLNK